MSGDRWARLSEDNLELRAELSSVQREKDGLAAQLGECRSEVETLRLRVRSLERDATSKSQAVRGEEERRRRLTERSLALRTRALTDALHLAVSQLSECRFTVQRQQQDLARLKLRLALHTKAPFQDAPAPDLDGGRGKQQRLGWQGRLGEKPALWSPPRAGASSPRSFASPAHANARTAPPHAGGPSPPPPLLPAATEPRFMSPTRDTGDDAGGVDDDHDGSDGEYRDDDDDDDAGNAGDDDNDDDDAGRDGDEDRGDDDDDDGDGDDDEDCENDGDNGGDAGDDDDRDDGGHDGGDEDGDGGGGDADSEREEEQCGGATLHLAVTGEALSTLQRKIDSLQALVEELQSSNQALAHTVRWAQPRPAPAVAWRS
ncbi:uncharacterized protein LOC116956774 isoform X1 [Petromyzon marinus]|uniref:uncharacterized protein LOC116956774 isoform X1 n=1 Tax=Petromyzon marinus TaxID=7757 RepID=UPI003F700865